MRRSALGAIGQNGTDGPGRQTTTPLLVAPRQECPLGHSSSVAQERVQLPVVDRSLAEMQRCDLQSSSLEQVAPYGPGAVRAGHAAAVAKTATRSARRHGLTWPAV